MSAFAVVFSFLFSAVLAIHFHSYVYGPRKSRLPQGHLTRRRTAKGTSWRLMWRAAASAQSAQSAVPPRAESTSVWCRTRTQEQNWLCWIRVRCAQRARTAAPNLEWDPPPGEELTVWTVVGVERLCWTVTLLRRWTLLCGGRNVNSCVNSGCLARSSIARVSW